MNASTNNLYYTMKTTNFIRIVFRIIVQSLVPMLLLELTVMILFGMIETAPTFDSYLGYATAHYTLVATMLLGSFIALFGVWFHFVSEHRFKNRRPKGLYQEYIAWFMDTEI